MTRRSDRARREVRDRSEFVNRPPEGTTPTRMPPAAPFFVVGLVLALLGLGVLGWFAIVSFRGESLDGLVPTLNSDFPPVALPIGIFMFAGSAVFLAEMFRRAARYTRTEWRLTRGSTSFRVRLLSLGARLPWMLVPLALYLALIPLPVLAACSSAEPSDDFWFLVTAHGFVSAGFVGIFLASLVKRASYRRASPTASRESVRTFWRVASVQWRVESWFGFVGAALAGVLPLAEIRGGDGPVSPDAVPAVAAIAIGCGIVSILAALAAPRSGMDEGEAESVV